MEQAPSRPTSVPSGRPRPASGRVLTEEVRPDGAPLEIAEASPEEPAQEEGAEELAQLAAVRVCIRLRPLLAWEKDQGHVSHRLRLGGDPQSIVAQEKEKLEKAYRFDEVLGPEATQEQVFQRVQLAPLVAKVVEGFAATVFAYGQTGSGKTYTIDGAGFTAADGREAPSVGTAKRSPGEEDFDGAGAGIVLRGVQQLFREVQAARTVTGDDITVKVSFLQIYNERVYDLLNPAHLRVAKDEAGGSAHPGLRLRWSPQKQFHVENLFVFECRTPAEVLAHFRAGQRCKAVGAHKLNFASSRSHAVLLLTVERTVDQAVRLGRLALVDLAGSERVARTAVEGQSLREAININQSLFVLRKVIAALASPKDADQHIPYRESKLTSLLKQSFGGNSFTVMLACLSPADAQFDDNLSTLQYATKARAIRNAPQVQLDPKSALILRLQGEVRDLRRRLSDAHSYIVSLAGSLPEYLRAGKKLSDAERARLASEAAESVRPTLERRAEPAEPAEKPPEEARPEKPPGPEKPPEEPRVEKPPPGPRKKAPPPRGDWARFDVQTLGERLTESVRVLGDAVQENKKLRDQMEGMAAQSAAQQRTVEELTRENVDLRENAAYLEAAATAEKGTETITKLSTIHDALLFQVLTLRKEQAALQRERATRRP